MSDSVESINLDKMSIGNDPMEAIKEFYTFQGIPLVFAAIVIILTLAACAGTIYRHHYQATAAIKEQYDEYKKHVSTKSKETKTNIKNRYSKNNSPDKSEPATSKKKPTKKEEEAMEEKRLRIRNETVEKATIATIMQLVGYIGLGFLFLTIIAAAF